MQLERSRWGSVVPWLMTGASFAVLLCLAWFLLANIYWFEARAFPADVHRDERFTLYAFHLHLSMVTRSVGLFSGFALIFIGTAVSFYTLRRETIIEGSSGGVASKLATASPGIVAMLLGTALIMFTISSKNEFEAIPEPASFPGTAPLTQPPVPPPA